MLQVGDRVGIVATAGKVKPTALDRGIALLQSWGLEVFCPPSVYVEAGYFAGTDQQRAADLQKLLDDPSIKAVFCARGGYGTTRIIDQIDFSRFLEQPKWLVGFSDITTLHNHIHQLGVQSLHGQTVSALKNDKASRSMKQVLFGEEYGMQANPQVTNRWGRGEGVLTGGNLSLLCNLLGTASEVDTSGKLLFIEEVAEPFYHFDRMMVQLLRAGKLHELQGLIVGGLTSMTNPDNKFALSLEQIVMEKVERFDYPVCFDFPVGHITNNWAMPCGKLGTLSVDADEVSLNFH